MKASIICCYYNEINLVSRKLKSFINKVNNSKLNLEIIIIDNNSTDGTRDKLKELKAKRLFKNIKFIFNYTNLGKGGSIKRACKIAKGKYSCIYDLDEYSTVDLFKGIKLIEKKSIDLLIGSRIHEKNKYIYKANYYGVRILTFIINFFFNTNLTDAAGATKIFNLSKYKSVVINSNGFDFEFELICKFAKKKFNINEYHTNYNPRSYEEGKKLKAWKDGSKILFIILKNIF